MRLLVDFLGLAAPCEVSTPSHQNYRPLFVLVHVGLV
jgi:hypothetical protein